MDNILHFLIPRFDHIIMTIEDIKDSDAMAIKEKKDLEAMKSIEEVKDRWVAPQKTNEGENNKARQWKG